MRKVNAALALTLLSSSYFVTAGVPWNSSSLFEHENIRTEPVTFRQALKPKSVCAASGDTTGCPLIETSDLTPHHYPTISSSDEPSIQVDVALPQPMRNQGIKVYPVSYNKSGTLNEIATGIKNVYDNLNDQQRQRVSLMLASTPANSWKVAIKHHGQVQVQPIQEAGLTWLDKPLQLHRSWFVAEASNMPVSADVIIMRTLGDDTYPLMFPVQDRVTYCLAHANILNHTNPAIQAFYLCAERQDGNWIPSPITTQKLVSQITWSQPQGASAILPHAKFSLYYHPDFVFPTADTTSLPSPNNSPVDDQSGFQRRDGETTLDRESRRIKEQLKGGLKRLGRKLNEL